MLRIIFILVIWRIGEAAVPLRGQCYNSIPFPTPSAAEVYSAVGVEYSPITQAVYIYAETLPESGGMEQFYDTGVTLNAFRNGVLIFVCDSTELLVCDNGSPGFVDKLFNALPDSVYT